MASESTPVDSDDVKYFEKLFSSYANDVELVRKGLNDKFEIYAAVRKESETASAAVRKESETASAAVRKETSHLKFLKIAQFLHDIIAQFLEFTDLANLEIALTNHQIRHEILLWGVNGSRVSSEWVSPLRLFNEIQWPSFRNENIIDLNHLCWLRSRGVRVLGGVKLCVHEEVGVQLPILSSFCNDLRNIDLSEIRFDEYDEGYLDDTDYTRTEDADSKESSICTIAAANPQLQSLNMSSIPYLSDNTLSTIGIVCNTLKCINLFHCVSLTNEGIVTFFSRKCLILEEINVSFTSISSVGLCVIAEHCPNLQKLDCSSLSDIREGLIAISNHCHELKSINCLHSDEINNAVIVALAENCRELVEIKFIASRRRNPGYLNAGMEQQTYSITSDALSAIAQHCPKLQALDCCGCQRFTRLPGVVAGIPQGLIAIATTWRQLNSLNINNCDELTDEDLSSIAQNSPNLRHLYILACVKITNVSLEALAENCPDLEVFEGDANFYTPEGLIKLFQYCTSLTRVRLDGMIELIDIALLALAYYSIRIKEFWLIDCNITDNGVGMMSQGCKQLQVLKFRSTDSSANIGDEAIRHIVTGMPMLHTLALPDSEKLTDVGILALCESCLDLKELELGDCDSFASHALSRISNFRNMRILSLNSGASDEVIAALSERCSKLEVLEIASSRKITDVSLMQIGVRMPKLLRLNLIGTHTTEEGRRRLKEILKNLEIAY